MSLLKRIQHASNQPQGILEALLKRLDSEGILQRHVESVLSERQMTLDEQQQNQLRTDAATFLIRDFLNQSRMPVPSRDSKRDIMSRFLAELDGPTQGFTPEGLQEWKGQFLDVIKDEGLQLSPTEIDQLWKTTVSEIIGLGPLDSLLADKTISEIVVLGYRTVYVMRDVNPPEKLNTVLFDDYNHLARLIDRIFRLPFRYPDEISTVLSARWRENVIATCIFPYDDYLDPILMFHTVDLQNQQDE